MRPLGIIASANQAVGGGTPPPDTELPSSPENIVQLSSGNVASTSWTSPAIGISVASSRLLVISGVANQTTGAVSTWTVNDSKNNIWIVTQAEYTGSTTCGFIAYTVVTNALTGSDTISIGNPFTISRVAIDILAWEHTFASTVAGAWNPVSGVNQVSGSANIPAESVVVGCHAMVNSGRTTSVTGGWTGLTKNLSTAGSGERAVQSAWRVDTLAANATTYPVTYTAGGGGTGVTGYIAFAK